MTRFLTILAFCLPLFAFSCNPAHAQERPTLTPEQKLAVGWVLANAVTALVVGAPVYIGAMLTGKREALCEVMHGKYNLSAPDQCAGGDWVRVIPYLPKPE